MAWTNKQSVEHNLLNKVMGGYIRAPTEEYRHLNNHNNDIGLTPACSVDNRNLVTPKSLSSARVCS